MSNPAVIKLVKDKIGGLSFWMDDNIGESIHIHLADFRLDLTVEELHTLAGELTDVIAEQIQVEGFDPRKIDPVFMSRMLAPLLPHLKQVAIDEVHLSDLLVCYDVKWGLTKYVKMDKARAVKALRGYSRENDDHRGSHHVGQTSSQRLSSMQDSIMKNGYPYNGQYIILYNDQMLVRDGQHRASCLYYENGDIVVPVMRLYFDESCDVSYSKAYSSQLIKRIASIRPSSVLRFFNRGYRFLVRQVRRLGNILIHIAKRREIAHMEEGMPT